MYLSIREKSELLLSLKGTIAQKLVGRFPDTQIGKSVKPNWVALSYIKETECPNEGRRAEKVKKCSPLIDRHLNGHGTKTSLERKNLCLRRILKIQAMSDRDEN